MADQPFRPMPALSELGLKKAILDLLHTVTAEVMDRASNVEWAYFQGKLEGYLHALKGKPIQLGENSSVENILKQAGIPYIRNADGSLKATLVEDVEVGREAEGKVFITLTTGVIGHG